MPPPTLRKPQNLLQLEEPVNANGGAPNLKAFLEMGFRPLYLGGVAWALVAIAVWIFAPMALTGPLNGIAWHAHEMLWGFIATIAVGFLMTAGTNWTGINPLQGPALGAVSVLWLVARVGYLVNSQTAFWIAVACELGFFLLAAVAMMRAVYASKNTRNYAVPWLLVGLGLGDGLYLLAARGGDYGLLMQRFNAALVVMALIALLVGRRVMPFFAMRAVPGLDIPKHTGTGQVQLGACAVAALALLLDWPHTSALALGVAGVLALVQVLSWKPLAVRHNPLLWILYAGYTGIGTGLLAAALLNAGIDLPRVLPVHLIAMAGFSVLIIGMVTRTALGHLGRALATDRSMRVSYWLMLVAVALRLGAIAAPGASHALLHAAGMAWVASLALYLWRFVPMLIRPRL
ncbi:MAG: NnrS family protein [Burkholderiales bacterium]|nr:NnrS family protein [Burkholderiales bacterium]